MEIDFNTFKKAVTEASEQFEEEYEAHGYAGLAALEEQLRGIASGDLPLPRRQQKDALLYVLDKNSDAPEGVSALEQLKALAPSQLKGMAALNRYQREYWRQIAQVRLFVLEDLLWSRALGLPVTPYGELGDEQLQLEHDEFLKSQKTAWRYAVIVAWVIVKHPELKKIKQIKEKIGAYRKELGLKLQEGEEGARMVRVLRNHFSWDKAAGFIETIPREIEKRGITRKDLDGIEPGEHTGQQLRMLAQDVRGRALKDAQ